MALLLLAINFFAIKEKLYVLSLAKKNKTKILAFILILSAIFSCHMVVRGQWGSITRYATDDIWHLALINELIAHFPPDNPGFSGIPLRGYHFFYDFLLAKVSMLSMLSPSSLYFHFFPFLTSVLWALGVYVVMFRWSNDTKTALWAVFLTLFGGSFAFLLPFYGHKGVDLDTAFGINQPALSLHNPHFALSIVFIAACLFAINRYLLLRKYNWLVPIALCIGLITEFKLYAGVILIGGFVSLVASELFHRKIASLIALFAIGVLFFLTYWIFTGNNAFLVFLPLWPTHRILDANFPWYGYTEKQYTYSHQSVIRGLVEIELYGLYIFIIGNLGTRLIRLLSLVLLVVKKYKMPSLFAGIVLIMTILSIGMPLLFIQSIRPFETIQFTWYFMFFASLMASFGLAAFFDLQIHRIVKTLIFLIVIVATVPSTIYDYSRLFPLSNGENIASDFYTMTNYLKAHGNYDATILEIPPQPVGASEKDLLAWFRQASSPLVIAFANKRGFLSSEYTEFPGVDIHPRIGFLQKILIFINSAPFDNEFSHKREEIARELKERKISYIVSSYPLPSLLSIQAIREVFVNKDEIIYQVN